MFGSMVLPGGRLELGLGSQYRVKNAEGRRLFLVGPGRSSLPWEYHWCDEVGTFRPTLFK